MEHSQEFFLMPCEVTPAPRTHSQERKEKKEKKEKKEGKEVRLWMLSHSCRRRLQYNDSVAIAASTTPAHAEKGKEREAPPLVGG